LNQEQDFLKFEKDQFTAEELSNYPRTFIIRKALRDGNTPWWSIFKGENEHQRAYEAARFLCRSVYKYTGQESHHNYVIYHDNLVSDWNVKMKAKWEQQCYVDSSLLKNAIDSVLNTKDRISQKHWEPYNSHTPSGSQPHPFRQLSYDLSVNTFRPSKIVAEQGDITPFLEHLNYLCDGNEEHVTYLLQWMAWKTQNPAEKLRCAIVLGSKNEGTGKSMIISCFAEVLGLHNSATTDLGKALGGKTDFLYRKLLVIVEEVKNMTGRQANNLKALITNDYISHDLKHGSMLSSEANYADFIFTTNHPDAIHADENGRRYFYLFSKAQRLPDQHYKDFMDWKDNGGVEALAHFLSNYPLTNFCKDAPPPITEAFKSAVDSSRSETESVLLEHLRDEDWAVTIDIVRNLLPERLRNLLTNKSIAKNLIKLGYTKGGRKIIKGVGKPTIYYKTSEISEAEGWKIIEGSPKYAFRGYG